MRLAAFVLFCLLPTLASANGLKTHGAATGDQPMTANVIQTGAPTAGDALHCDRSVVIENPETAKAISEKAESDADQYAGRLADLPAAAQASVATLAGAHALDPSLLGRAYFTSVCERLAGKGGSPGDLKLALQNLAQALGVAYPSAAPNGAPAETAAKEETGKAASEAPGAPPAAAPGTEPGLEIPKMATDTPQAQSGSQTPADASAETSAPVASPVPSATAPATPQPPSVGEAPAPAPAQTAETQNATSLEAAPAGSDRSVMAAAPPIVLLPQAPPPDLTAPQPVPAAPASEAPAAAPPAQTAETPAASEPAPGTPAAPAPQVAETPAVPAPAETPPASPSPPAQVAETPAAPAPAATPAAPETPPSPQVAETPTAPAPAAPETPATPPSPPAQVAEAPASSEPTPAAPDTASPAPQAAESPAAPETPPAPAATDTAAPTPQVAETPAAPETPAASPAAPEAPAAAPSPPAQVAETPPSPETEPSPAAPPPSAPLAETPAQPEAAPPPSAAPEPGSAGGGAAKTRARAAASAGAVDRLGEVECRALGVLDNCPDLNAVLDRLMERPLEYNHPDTMLLGRKTEITLVLRTDWEGKDMPADVSEELKGLPGEVKQGLTKITRVMSAELTGRDFDISPSNIQERTVVPPQPVSWTWQVSPSDTGDQKPLKLRLYAHLQSGTGTMPPILIKTLDANINVDVTTWDWVVNQARTLEPIYAIAAALLGLITAMLTYVFTRRRAPAAPGGAYRDVPGPRDSGPVIGDLGQSAAERRPAAPPPVAPPPPAPPPKAETPPSEPAAPPPAKTTPPVPRSSGHSGPPFGSTGGDDDGSE